MTDEKIEVQPPWVEYERSEPTWSGWRQGPSERWLLDVWLPFWKGLTPEGRRSYLRKFPPPTEDWDFYLNVAWIR